MAMPVGDLKENIPLKHLFTIGIRPERILKFSQSSEPAQFYFFRLVRQLQDSGHISEASTLLLRYRGSHTVFATFGSSMSQISNWLKNNA